MVHRHALGVLQLGCGGRAAVAGEPAGAGPGHSVNVTSGHRLPVDRATAAGDHPDPVAALVGDHQVASVVYRHLTAAANIGPLACLHKGAGRRAAITQRPGTAGARHRGQPAGLRADHPHRRADVIPR